MKELISLFENDTKEFTTKEKVVYGVIVPMAFVAALFLTSWIENL